MTLDSRSLQSLKEYEDCQIHVSDGTCVRDWYLGHRWFLIGEEGRMFRALGLIGVGV